MSISKDSTIVEKATEFFWLFPDEIPVFIKSLKKYSYTVVNHRKELKKLCKPEQISQYNLFVLSAQRIIEILKEHKDTIDKEIKVFAYSLFGWLYVDFVINYLKIYAESETGNEALTVFVSKYFK
jgi:hypothetical protein